MINTSVGFKISLVYGVNYPNNKWVPDFIEKPYKEMNNSIDELNDKLDAIGFWLNPANWVKEAWQGIEHIVMNPDTAYTIMGGTIVGAWLIMLGAQWPKKWIFWGWIIYWTLRGGIFE